MWTSYSCGITLRGFGPLVGPVTPFDDTPLGLNHRERVRRALGQLAAMLLSYVVCLTLLATLSPFRFQVPERRTLSLAMEPHDLVLNLLLLAPAGFLVGLMHNPPSGTPQGASLYPQTARSAPAALGLGVLLSTTIEGLQWFSPVRVSSPIDVAMNGLGALLGGALFGRLRPWLGRSLDNELTLRLPLSHLFYLLTVLLLIDGLMAHGRSARLWLSLPLSLCGAVIAGAIYRHRLVREPHLSARRVGLFCAAWSLIAGAPGWLRAPEVGLGSSACAGLCGYILARRRPATDENRRFELPTLGLLSLPFGLYLLLLSHFSQLPRGGSGAHDHRLVFDAIEAVAAHTVLGYGVAEAMGRRNLARSRALGLASTLVMAWAAASEWAACLLHAMTPRIWVIPAAGAFAGWGAAIYRAELRLIQILARGSTRDPGTAHRSRQVQRP